MEKERKNWKKKEKVRWTRLKWLHGCIFRWQNSVLLLAAILFFGVADFFLTLLLVQSDLILGTLASFGSKYTAGGFLHGWALKCTTGSAFALALSLVWIFLFGLLVVFDQVGQVY